MSPVDPVVGDLLGALLHHGAHPHAQIGGHDVHQAESGDALELVDVELEASQQFIIVSRNLSLIREQGQDSRAKTTFFQVLLVKRWAFS